MPKKKFKVDKKEFNWILKKHLLIYYFLTLIMKKILISISTLAFVAVVIAGATGAFYGDTETSTGNTFTAGAIDLRVDSVSHYNNMICTASGTNGSTVYTWQAEVGFNPGPEHFPQTGSSCNGTWQETDLEDGVHTFFNFLDLKPGDMGEDTISLHVYNNDAWGELVLANVIDTDNDCTEPEQDMEGGSCGIDDTDGGEIDSYLKFTGWLDQGLTPGFQCGTLPNNAMCATDPAEGDNEYQTQEGPKFWDNALISELNEFEISEALSASYTAKGCTDPDGNTNYAICHGLASDGRMVQSTSYYFGLAWELPLLETGNDAQTDSYGADMAFYVEQHRNNPNPFIEGPAPTPEKIGALLSSYVAPVVCDANVDDSFAPTTTPNFTTIQSAINDASTTNGETICVAAGTYPEIVNVNKSVIIAGLGTVGSAVLNGGFIIDADNITVKGFEVTGGNTEGTFAGFYIKSGADNTTVRDNELDGPAIADASGSRGIVNVENVPVSNIMIQNNFIHEWTSGIYTSPHVGGGTLFTIRGNDIYNNLAGIGDLNSALVEKNEFQHSLPVQEAIGAGTDYDIGTQSVVRTNNFLDGTMVNDYGAVATIAAENNFWNLGGITQTTAGQVDFTPEAGVAFPHN